MKKLTKMMALLLVVMLAVCTSAAIAETKTGDNATFSNNACTVKVMIGDDRTPFVTWSFPSEIDIKATMEEDDITAELVGKYYITISDWAMRTSQWFYLGMRKTDDAMIYGDANVTFTDGPLDSAVITTNSTTEFVLAYLEMLANDDGEVELELTLKGYEPDYGFVFDAGSSYVNDFPKTYSHIIGAYREFEADSKIYFALELVDE